MPRLKFASMFVLGLVLLGYSEAAAQPPAAAGLAAREGKTIGFRWNATSGATWYYLWINDSTNTTRHHRWYPAYELDCAVGQSLVCKIGLTLDATPGQFMWWVQTYGDAGYGPWTAAQTYTAGPLAAVVSGAGALNRGNAVSASRLAAGTYEVLFNRNVSNCIFIATIGGPGGETPVGLVSAALRGGNVNGVFVLTSNTLGVAVDLPFNLNVVCGATQ